jgi:hypothetical protein
MRQVLRDRMRFSIPVIFLPSCLSSPSDTSIRKKKKKVEEEKRKEKEGII